MDIGLVCDECDSFNLMNAPTCAACGTALSLGGGKRASAKMDASSPSASERGGTPFPAAPGPSPRPRVSGEGVAMPPGGSPSLSMPVTFPRPCPACGEALQPGFRFCGSCGARTDAVPAASESPAVAASHTAHAGHAGGRSTMFFGAMQAARAKLVLIKGDGLDGVSYTLAGQDHIAGRVEGPLLFPDDPYLSPKHANFFYRDGKLHVQDEGSANGLYVRIRTPNEIQSGDTFLVGEQVLRVEATPPEATGLGPDEVGTFYFASPRRSSRMRLVQLLRGGDTGLIHRATGDAITLGRAGNDINFPEDPFISGRHAQVAFGAGGLLLTDLGSKNGTFLRMTRATLLSHGDYVFMGQQLLRVEIV